MITENSNVRTHLARRGIPKVKYLIRDTADIDDLYAILSLAENQERFGMRFIRVSSPSPLPISMHASRDPLGAEADSSSVGIPRR